MSVIVAIKDKNRIVVGVDSRMSASDGYFDSYLRRPKAVHIGNNKDIIVGAVGNIGLADVLIEHIRQYEEKDLYRIDKSFIIKYIIPALAVNARDYQMIDNKGRMDGIILLAIKDKAYLIPGNFSVEEITDYAAEGSGRDAVLGSLYTSAMLYSIPPEEKIRLAIEAAGSCISSVSQTAYIGDTAGKVFSVFDMKKSKKH